MTLPMKPRKQPDFDHQLIDHGNLEWMAAHCPRSVTDLRVLLAAMNAWGRYALARHELGADAS